MLLSRAALTCAMTATVLTSLSIGQAAHADCEEASPVIDQVRVYPNPLNIRDVYGHTVTIEVVAHDVGGYDACLETFYKSGIRSVDAELTGESSPDYDFVENFQQVSGDGYQGTWRGSVSLDKDNAMGLWSVSVEVEDNDYNYTSDNHAAYFKVKHGTRIRGFDAAPEPVKKGSTIKITGKFQRLKPYVGWDGARSRVDYYFRKSGANTWTHMGYNTSRSSGRFVKYFTAKTSGTWAARFNGAGFWLTSNGPTDAVKVL